MMKTVEIGKPRSEHFGFLLSALSFGIFHAKACAALCLCDLGDECGFKATEINLRVMLTSLVEFEDGFVGGEEKPRLDS